MKSHKMHLVWSHTLATCWRLGVAICGLMLIAMPSHANPPPIEVCLSNCITLKSPAKRVVALNWSAAEMLLTLNLVPVGVTQVSGYKKWQTNHPAMPDQVIDVGRRQEPALNAIAKLQPDLIIGYQFRHQRIHSALSNIAPTLLFQQYPEANQPDFLYLEAIPPVFLGIAKAVGQQALAEQKLAHMEHRLAALKQQLAQAQLNHTPLVYGKFIGMGYGLRVFGQQSLAGGVAQRLGLQYQWHQVLPGKDFTHLQLEQLGKLSHHHLLLADNQSDNTRFTASPVWQAMPFILENRASSTPPLWSFGGPDSVIKMAQAFADSLLMWQSNAIANQDATHPRKESGE